MIDMPDVPPQYAPVMFAQASQARSGDAKTDRTSGICHLIENDPESRLSAKNSLSPVVTVWGYFQRQEHQRLDHKNAKVSLLQAPEHGTLEDLGTFVKRRGALVDTGMRNYSYVPASSDYFGPDRAMVLVEIGGYKVKVQYFFKVMQSVPGGSDQGSPQDDKENCPKGEMWRISVN